MRSAYLAAVIATALSGAPSPAQVARDPAYDPPVQPWHSVEDAERLEICRDRVEHARAAASKPQLERGPARPYEPLLIYAVDRRIDGCGVLAPVSDPADIRYPPRRAGPRSFQRPTTGASPLGRVRH